MNGPHSNDSPTNQQPDDAVWDQIAEKVDALVLAWDQLEAGSSPPNISELLVDVAPKHRAFVACELIKIDLEYRWNPLHNCPQKLTAYVEDLDAFESTDALPADSCIPRTVPHSSA